MRTYRLPALLPLLSLLLLVIGCGSPFPPRTLVERLRVLGIRSEPADIDLQSTVTLSALVVGPTGNVQAPTTTWAVCAPGINYETFATDCPSDTSFSLPSGEPLPITGEPSTTIVVPDLVAQIEQRGYTITSSAQVVDIWIALVVSANGEEVHALKRIPVHLDGSTQRNNNPKLIRLDDPNTNRVSGSTIALQLGAKTRLDPIVDETLRDIFTPSGETTARQEDFVFSWFSTIGKFDYFRTVSAADSQNDKLDENVWSIPESLTVEQKTNSLLWVVVRDGRFGIHWQAFTGIFY